MFLYLSKYVPLFIYPLGLGLLLLAAALLISIWRRGWCALLLAFCFLLLWIPSTPAFSDYLLSSLEMDYSPQKITQYPEAGSIVILSGAVSKIGLERVRADANFDRLLQGWRLYKADKAEYIVVSGGNISWMTKRKARTGAARMAEMLRQLGVPEARIISEGKSRNTRENAVYTAQLLQDKGVDKVLLCTSALHLRRAKACFEQSGIHVVPVPAAYEYSFYKKASLLDYLPQAMALENSTKCCKEYLGIVYYWLRGWI